MAGADVDVPLTCSSRGEILGIQSENVKVCKPWDSAEAEATDGAHPGEASFRILRSIAPQLAQSSVNPPATRSSKVAKCPSIRQEGRSVQDQRCRPRYPPALVCRDNFGSWDLQNRAIDYDAGKVRTMTIEMGPGPAEERTCQCPTRGRNA
ncbi:hypothetical protein BN1708_012099 [Verticillium longisporum]|uniref:Uncharacterized protein n=1 Tax=Verticillium longisporum TaxID=100787 RepID=A0A0G4L670_VERLO|nr:hypothetical protein BN1708_012099 [Verticillium longisporum]